MDLKEAKKIDDLFNALMDDVRTSCEFWHDRTDDFSRRIYVKSAVSTIEGVIQVIKKSALFFDKWNDTPILSTEEYYFLKK